MLYKRLLFGSSLVVFLLLSRLTLAQSTVDFSTIKGFGVFVERPDLVQINNIRIDTVIQIPFEVGRIETAYYNILLKACASGETVYLEPILSAEEPSCIPSRFDFSASVTVDSMASFDRLQFDNVQLHTVVADPANPEQTVVTTEQRSLLFRYDPIMIRLVQVVTPRQVTVSLNWGDNPRDLDAHLTGPACVKQHEFDFSCDENSKFHIYFRSNFADIAFMEVGEFETKPENIAILPPWGLNTLRPGFYRYVVHHFSGTGDIANSGTVVHLRVGDEPARVFTPPPDPYHFLGGEYDAWTVFELQVTPEGMVDIIPIQRYDRNVNPVDGAMFFH